MVAAVTAAVVDVFLVDGGWAETSPGAAVVVALVPAWSGAAAQPVVAVVAGAVAEAVVDQPKSALTSQVHENAVEVAQAVAHLGPAPALAQAIALPPTQAPPVPVFPSHPQLCRPPSPRSHLTLVLDPLCPEAARAQGSLHGHQWAAQFHPRS